VAVNADAVNSRGSGRKKRRNTHKSRPKQSVQPLPLLKRSKPRAREYPLTRYQKATRDQWRNIDSAGKTTTTELIRFSYRKVPTTIRGRESHDGAATRPWNLSREQNVVENHRSRSLAEPPTFWLAFHGRFR